MALGAGPLGVRSTRSGGDRLAGHGAQGQARESAFLQVSRREARTGPQLTYPHRERGISATDAG